ncbi:MAG: c-type cytochrome biogenesis protein CcmI [Gammaproteobacteria bacterium]|nr:c-type cytochrome biogenesis protein CcmI [Gammaproteobacteria bacterium]
MIFWIVASGLLLLALLILVLPMLRTQSEAESNDRQQQNIDIARANKSVLDIQLSKHELSQQEYDSSLHDLETALALDLENTDCTARERQGKWAIWLLVGLVPLFSIGLYFKLGEYRVIEDPTLMQAGGGAQTQNQRSDLSIEEMIEIVQQRLRENPDDAQGWFVLGKTLMAQQRFDQAVTAFQRTHDLVGEEPGVIFSLADAIAMQNDGVMQGEPEQLVKRGLDIAPNHSTGLWLAGLAAEQRQDYPAAHASWTRLLSQIENDPASIAEISELIKILEQRDPTLASASVDIRLLTLKVELNSSLRPLVKPGDSVFVYAKAANGPPMPLAVKRLRVSDLPVEVTLSDMDAMMPEMKLSAFDLVVVGARISKSGNPVAQPGDLFVEVKGVDSKNPPPDLLLSINQVK